MTGQHAFEMRFELTAAADDMTLIDLIVEAEVERVPELLTEYQLVLTGPIDWRLDIEGPEPILVGQAPAAAWDGRGGYCTVQAAVAA